MMLYAVRSLFEYHYAMFDRVWEIVDTLTSEQFLRESKYPWRSIRNQLVHCSRGEERWLARLQKRTPPAHFEFARYPIKRLCESSGR